MDDTPDNKPKKQNTSGDVTGFLLMLVFAAMFGGLILWIWNRLAG